MQLKKIPVDANLEKLRVLQDFQPPKLKFFIPMPDFALKGPLDFRNVPGESPFPLVKDIEQRFPSMMDMPEKHPAFSVVLMHVVPKFFTQMDALDWGYHKEVLRRARIRDELSRIVHRVEIEDIQRELHGIREDQRVADVRAHFFEQVKLRAWKQTDIIRESSLHAYDISAQNREELITLRDEQKFQNFLYLYLKEYSPSKVALKKRIHLAQTEPSLAQVRLAQSVEVTPLELLIQIAAEKFPIMKKEEIGHLFAKFAQHLNSVHLHMSMMAEFRTKVSQMFETAFQLHHHNGVVQKAMDQKVHRTNEEYRSFQLAKSDKSKETAREQLDLYLDHLAVERKLFDNAMEHFHHEKGVKEAYGEKQSEAREHFRALEKFVPLLIKGETQFVQLNPVKYQTQYAIIEHWLDTVAAVTNRENVNLNERVDMQVANQKRAIHELNAHTLADAKEADRMRHAMLVHDYFKRFDIHDTIAAFNAVAMQNEAAKTQGHAVYAHEQVAKNPDNKIEVPEASAASSFKVVV